jgi:Family of unknown function (DUF6152)
MRHSKARLIVGLAVTLGVSLKPAMAHHSFEAEYDDKRTATLTGIVTKVDWVNPHAYIFINMKDEGGATKELRIELGPPYALVRGGWKKDTVKIGDNITVENAALAKNPANSWAGSLPTTFLLRPDGSKLPMR